MGKFGYDSYASYLSSPEWQKKRLQKLLACEHNDQFMCIKCEGCGLFIPWKYIEVHHLTYERIGEELIDDLAALCDGCHNQAHGISPPLWWQAAMEHESLMVTERTIRMEKRGPRAIDQTILEVLATIDLAAIRAEVKRWKRNRLKKLPK